VKRERLIERILNKRSSAIYGGMKARSNKQAMVMPFTLATFRTWLDTKFDIDGSARCEYSGELLLAENFSVDHRDPISRGGSFDINNLALCTEKHNLRKGNMNYQEYKYFMLHVSGYVHDVQAAIWRKLEVGDVQRFSHFRRKKARV
jgi:5-methylcytosine-specific restriction endonuclease McrA